MLGIVKRLLLAILYAVLNRINRNSRPLLFALLVLKLVVKMTFLAIPFLVVEAVHDVYYV